MRRYQPEIDGLRAIAVTAVILFHGHILPIPGGFAGVDVFFVLSGFLITSILAEELDAGTFSLWQFYERRVRRIFPALFFVLGVTTVLAWALLIPPQLEAYSKSLAAVVLFVSNFLFAAKTGYFSPALEEAPLLHTWSLAVEEQFYLLFPLALAALHRRARRWLPLALGLMAALSLALAIWGSKAEPQINFFFPLSRAWELLAGSTAAIWVRKRSVAPNEAWAGLGLLAILASLVLHSDATPYPGLATLLPVMGTVAVVLWAGQTTLVGRVLSTRAFVGVGLVSYSAYLWHQPIFALIRVTSLNAPGWAVMAGGAVLAYGLAALTWAYVEQPFRRKDRRWVPTRRALFVLAAVASVVALAIAGLGKMTDGNAAGWRALHPDRTPRLDMIEAARASHEPFEFPATGCVFNLIALDDAATNRIKDCAAKAGPASVILGDSHAIDVMQGISRLGQAPFLLGLTNGGCRPADMEDGCLYTAFAQLAHDRPDWFGQILFVQSGSYLLAGADGRGDGRQLFVRASPTAPLTGLMVDQAQLDRLATYLGGLNEDVPVTWLGSRIEPHVSPNQILARSCDTPVPLRPGQAEIFASLDAAAAQAAEERQISYLPMDLLQFDVTKDFMTCQTLFWSDGDHWNTAGEDLFLGRLAPHLSDWLRGSTGP